MKQVYKLVGSIDILGNPVGLFNGIGTGVVDLFDKPMKGFVKGPLEGGKGMIIGASSLVKHTFAGTFNSVGKITGSIGSGLTSIISGDKEYIEKRKRLKTKKPKGVFSGVGQGIESIGTGLLSGVTGVFTQPLEGFKKDGFVGGLKGLFKGATGLVVKPITGILDGVSKTAEGLKQEVT